MQKTSVTFRRSLLALAIAAASTGALAAGNAVLAIGGQPETLDPYNTNTTLTTAVTKTFYEGLFEFDKDLKVKNVLAESYEMSKDGLVYTFKLRQGVKFHDGTDFNAAAAKANLDRVMNPENRLLRATQFNRIAKVEAVNPQTLRVTLKEPFAPFINSLAHASAAMISPAALQKWGNKDIAFHPVGTGPFVYDDYKVNESFTMKKNADYWNQPYPYLDSIEFRPIQDALSRRDALVSGTIDILHSSNGQTIADARDTTDYKMTEITNNGETAYTLLHVTQTLADGSPSPLTDQRVRCALAYASDEQLLIDTIGAGVNQISFGPFSPTQVGYLEHTGFPEAQDMAKAQELIAAYKAEHPGKLTLSLATTTDQTNLTIAQQQQQWWTEAGFDEVTIDQIDQAAYILTAAVGNFQVFQWRNHGGFDLDMQYHWWHSSASKPVGELALNFGRIRDDQLDALLEENRASDDPVRKKEIAEEVNRLFGTQCYNIWGSYTIWGIMYKNNVHGPTTFALPDGKNVAFGAGFAGTFYAMDLWVDQ